MKDNQTVLTPPPEYEKALKSKDQGSKVFAFDRSYWSFNRDAPNFAGQPDLFDDLGQPLLDNAFQGYNNCIFAYVVATGGSKLAIYRRGVVSRNLQRESPRLAQPSDKG